MAPFINTLQLKAYKYYAQTLDDSKVVEKYHLELYTKLQEAFFARKSVLVYNPTGQQSQIRLEDLPWMKYILSSDLPFVDSLLVKAYSQVIESSITNFSSQVFPNPLISALKGFRMRLKFRPQLILDLATDAFSYNFAFNFSQMAQLTYERHKESVYGLYYGLETIPYVNLHSK